MPEALCSKLRLTVISCLVSQNMFFSELKEKTKAIRWKSKYSIEEIKRMGLYKSTEDVKG